MPKVVVGCESLEQLESLEAMARKANLPATPIYDAGRTVVPEGAYTCLGIGPATTDALEPITGKLKLVR